MVQISYTNILTLVNNMYKIKKMNLIANIVVAIITIIATTPLLYLIWIMMPVNWVIKSLLTVFTMFALYFANIMADIRTEKQIKFLNKQLERKYKY